MKEGITREIEDIKFQKDSIVKIFMLFFSNWTGTSLVVQWLRIHLPMQGTQVSLLGEIKSYMLWGDQASMPELLSPLATTKDST